MAAQVQVWLEKGATSLAGTINIWFTNMSGFFLNAAGKIPSLFIIFIVFVIALYMFTFSLPVLRSSFLSLFESSSQLKMEQVLLNLRGAVFGYMRAQMIMAAMTYLITFIGLLIIDSDYPMAISVLVMVMEFVPVIGTGLVFIPWAGYQLLIGHTSFALEILVLFTVLTIFRRIVEPKVISDAVGINALSAMISLYVGFELLGVIGLFIGPMVVILVQVMRKAGLLQMNIKLD
jgi:sporulation integral membrane protein YtvI